MGFNKIKMEKIYNKLITIIILFNSWGSETLPRLWNRACRGIMGGFCLVQYLYQIYIYQNRMFFNATIIINLVFKLGTVGKS